MSDLDQQEGGIVSAFMAVRGLLEADHSAADVDRPESIREAQRYLVERQNPTTGGFGRFVLTRGLPELHTSVRHTALAVSTLLRLGGPVGSISQGVRSLEHWRASDDWWQSDGAPAIALASMIHLGSQLKLGILDGLVNESDFNNIWFSGDIERRLFGKLVDLSVRSDRAPLFPPYGGIEELTLQTSMITIDLLPSPTPSGLRPMVGEIITTLRELMEDGGLPYVPGRGPDIGMSAHFLSLLLMRPLSEDPSSTSLLATAEQLVEFIEGSWNDPRRWAYTFADTISNLLRLSTYLTDYSPGTISV